MNIGEQAILNKEMSSPSRGTWIEITTVSMPALAALVVPLAGDVD